MKFTDEQLQAHLARNLPPEELNFQSDGELEAMLDAETVVRPRFAPLLLLLAAAAAAVLVLGTAIAVLNRGGQGDADGLTEAGSISGQPDPISTPVPVPEPQRSAPPQQLVDVEIEFPKPVFGGPPVRVVLPNLERPGKPRLELKAPVGTKLVSHDVKVTSSDSDLLIGDVEMITDGDKDGTDGSYVELGPGRQWVQLDLGGAHELWGVVVWHFHKNTRAYDDVVVQISADPEFADGVTTVLNNDHDNSSGLGEGTDLAWIETNHGRIIDVSGVSARYVRLYSNGNTANEMNHYVEVEVYGR